MSTTTACDLFHRCVTLRASDDWQEFIQRYGRRIRDAVRRALQRLGERFAEPDLDEFVQEVYCRLLAARGRRFCGRTEPELWVYLARVAGSLVLDHRRAAFAAKRRREMMTIGWDEDAYAAHRAVTATSEPSPEECALLNDALRFFLDRCRRAASGTRVSVKMRVARLAFIEGQSSREISRLLAGELTPGQVDSLIYRMRQQLARDGIRIPHRGRGGKQSFR